MANNRMWLVHKPTGKRALIAKHWDRGWQEYLGEPHEPFYSIQGLFDETNDYTDFEIEYEIIEKAK